MSSLENMIGTVEWCKEFIHEKGNTVRGVLLCGSLVLTPSITFAMNPHHLSEAVCQFKVSPSLQENKQVKAHLFKSGLAQ